MKIATINEQAGLGNWKAFSFPLDTLFSLAKNWKAAVQGVSRPWLCWHVNDRWTKIQIALVKSVGWTPIIGCDPRFHPPTHHGDAIFIDFNHGLNLPLMYMHFPLEFAFLWAPRLAFWHSDLLCRTGLMRTLGDTFAQLNDGSLSAVKDLGGRRHWLNFRRHRYWELVGCTTAGASEDQFRHGTGWWQHFGYHPNCPSEKERVRRQKHYYDHGTGIMYWARHCGGKINQLDRGPIEEGHCTSINFAGYKRVAHISQKMLGAELDLNFNLDRVLERLELTQFG